MNKEDVSLSDGAKVVRLAQRVGPSADVPDLSDGDMQQVQMLLNNLNSAPAFLYSADPVMFCLASGTCVEVIYDLPSEQHILVESNQ